MALSIEKCRFPRYLRPESEKRKVKKFYKKMAHKLTRLENKEIIRSEDYEDKI